MSDPFGGKAKENANPTIYAVQNGDSGEVKRRQKQLLHRKISLLIDDDEEDGDEYDTGCSGAYKDIDRYNIEPYRFNGNENDDEEEDERGMSGDNSTYSIYNTAWRVRSNLARTAEERSVYLALREVSEINPDSTKLLRDAGFVLPSKKRNGGSRPRIASSMLSEPPFVLSHHYEGAKGTSEKNKKKKDKFDANEVFDIIRNIQDPEHPLTLEQLNVVNVKYVKVVDISGDDDDCVLDEGGEKMTFSTVDVGFTPTIPHCSMATLIGLCIRVKLLRSLPRRFKVTVFINPGTHASEQAVNRQLDDKERVCAALENKHLLGVVNRCIAEGMRMSD